ncbi:gene transfer agent family protein [Bradyrhizobium sp. BR 1433]|uniref:gene transfer agent family protein n=1 Tax=Bradyrhizobium sp. BR 1433 TaxID=3447967 RepID=UPI003EE6FFBA
MQLEIRRPFAGRERTLRLRIGEVAELERLANAGIGAIMVRLATHQFYASDVREAIRLGLQGGGLTEPEATAIVMGSVDSKPLGEHIQLAADIIGAYVSGIPDDIKKKTINRSRADGCAGRYERLVPPRRHDGAASRRGRSRDARGVVGGFQRLPHVPCRQDA